jgi:DNA-binding transcriptional LysR family regulator
MVLKGEIDLAIVHSSRRYPQIIREPFGNEPVIACVSRKHPLAAKKILTADDLKQFGFVTRRFDDTATSERFFDGLRKRGLSPRTALECDSAEIKRAAVKSQIGIGLLYKPLVEEDLKTGELVEIQLPGGRLPGNSYIVYHKSRTLSSAARDFLELLRQYRAQLQNRSEEKRLRELFQVQGPVLSSESKGSRFNIPPPNSELKIRRRSI